MAAPKSSDVESDYGSDFSPEDQLLLIELASEQRNRQSASEKTNLTSKIRSGGIAGVDSLPGRTDTTIHDEHEIISGSETFGGLQSLQPSGNEPPAVGSDVVAAVSLDKNVTYPDLSRALTEVESHGSTGEAAIDIYDAESDGYDDGRTPLQMFRSYPRKPLTVTDLTAGSWCELQYWYTLTKLPGGRRTKTPAMKGGSKIHKKLEDEVHTTIQIDVLTKEDGFALRLWNFIQGLRTLRETGLTRELEVWGVVHGNFVNGVIDAVSHNNPNPEFEEELAEQTERDPNQTSLTDFFTQSGKSHETISHKIYLIDVKTRGSLTPVSKPLLRPAKIQLLLYHRFLSDIAAGKLDFLKLFRRYGLDPDDTLSDGFIAQIGHLHDEIFEDSVFSAANSIGTGDSQNSVGSENSISPKDGLLNYQTLRELISLVDDEVKLAFPEGEASMGQMLRVQYVHRDDGRELDIHDFPASHQVLDTYLTRYMRWWQGERKAVGVDIEEAFKCRTCEFAPECSWRNALAEEQMQKAQRRVWARRKTGESSVQ
ncbi:hypothetical protein QQS21_005998 [Conoideocrella luteorostrata]|uniref:Exonuclease V n=1 Tax=Conoideocrella luteorostrata TaxID=1105319 RepID=A0AAJ0FYL9_9HYPO|nr:hypothetical protein QQS21_005998 [Conoideocrella luteorostrata]